MRKIFPVRRSMLHRRPGTRSGQTSRQDAQIPGPWEHNSTTMKPDAEYLRNACPGIDERLINQHLNRLPDRYFETFDFPTIRRHLQALDSLRPAAPATALVDFSGGERVQCTVLAFDYPAAFSLIAGLLSSLGVSILSGSVYTYCPAEELRKVPRSRHGRNRARRALRNPFYRRRIVDAFAGTVTTSLSPKAWIETLKKRLHDIFAILERGGRDSVPTARSKVNEMVSDRLAELQAEEVPRFHPVEIDIDNDADYTRLNVSSQDTPFFLYALSNALSLHNVSIEQVRIETRRDRIHDEIDILDDYRRKIDDPGQLNRIKLCVLLTKQFTHFLGNAPEPYAALDRFERLVEEVVRLPEQGKWVDILSDPLVLRDLSRLLGTSDFMWEDFIRVQYENLLPMLAPQVRERPFHTPAAELETALDRELAAACSYTEKKKCLNDFKDREIYRIDLDHILTPSFDFRTLAERLTRLAELVVRRACSLACQRLADRYGRPRTIAGLEAAHAIFGLGKFGGVALGYASDIELLLLYDDNGKTDGSDAIRNAEFFNRLVQELTHLISTKRDGIFTVDLRLRPYGQDGPLAVSLASFCAYYGPGGRAHSYEHLALVRLRAIGGSPELGQRVERLRDQIVYDSPSIDLDELRALRQRQFQEKSRPGAVNAKFSPGALVDLEYDVQILQIIYGRENHLLRTPRLHHALEALAQSGVISSAESNQLQNAYAFLRQLINGLRMLRGSARDLFLPPPGTSEFRHLARRMGYEPRPSFSPDQQLRLDFDSWTAAVRAFVERHFGRESLPGADAGNVADLVLSEQTPDDVRRSILSRSGFSSPDTAYHNLKHLAAYEPANEAFARLAVLACDFLQRTPDPDMALNNWERFVRELPDPGQHYRTLLSQPMRLDILMAIFAGSQFLADTLIGHPDFLDWVTIPELLHTVRSRACIERDARNWIRQQRDDEHWTTTLRRLRRRELLRIGTRDICLHRPCPDVMTELSNLAEALIQVALDQVWIELEDDASDASAVQSARDNLCILAFGKLGGGELNYSSDIDLVGICRDFDEVAPSPACGAGAYARFAAKAMERLRRALSASTPAGYVYRVDFRLRPYGQSGILVHPLSSLLNYYEKTASLWEIQALLKMRAVAGASEVGERFMSGVGHVFQNPREPEEIVSSIDSMRAAGIRAVSRRRLKKTDLKSGLGGIRDVEFLVQGLQLLHLPRTPELLTPNTLEALERLERSSILQPETAGQLASDYLFLRRVEHFLQLFEDRQVHALPPSPEAIHALAKRVIGLQADGDTFLDTLNACRERVRTAYETFLLNLTGSGS